MSTLKKIRGFVRSFFPKRMKDYPDWVAPFRGLRGLEVGGPSFAFSSIGFLPLYPVIASLDGCNFSTTTVWEGDIKEGDNFRYEKKTGRQFIADATALPMIKDESYDFLLSCHSLEHLANPIKALKEWRRVLKPGGLLLLIVPHRDATFDHKRPITTLSHLIQDYEQNMGEDDTTHFEEVIALHDIGRDRGVKDLAGFTERTKNNLSNRCVHHHTFNTPGLAKLVDYTGFEILKVSNFKPTHIVVLAKKSTAGSFNNAKMLDQQNPVFQNSMFPSDRLG
jgi:SAM-dependent methyltransferase